MKINFIIPIFLLFVLNSCNKQEPVSSFVLTNNDTITVLIIGTTDEFTANSDSKYSNSVLWDFGDGRTSTDKDIVVSYPKSGTYMLKLAAINEVGESVSSKKIIVKDRVLRYISVSYVQWDKSNLTEPWPRSDTADIYFQMQLFTDASKNADGLYDKCPILYTSPIIKNIINPHRPSPSNSIFIPVTEKIIVQKELVKFAYANVNNAYLFSLMARDTDGKTYRLIDNTWVGVSFGITVDDIMSNTFKINQGGFTSYDMVCDFQ